MTTSPSITFGLYNLAIKTGSTPSASSIQPLSDITDLKTGNVNWQSFATFEDNFWKLDGSYRLLAASANHEGWVSLSQSDVSGNFATPPVLTITLDVAYSTTGLSMTFFRSGPDYPTHLLIQYYDVGSALIRQDAYYPTTYELSTGQAVAGIKQIVITFYSTNNPYRYLRVRSIDYGTIVKFTGSSVMGASLVEEIDPTVATLPFDTVEFDILSEDAQFSIVNPAGNYAGLQNRQPLDVYETVDGEDLYMGRFYLDTWANVTNNQMHFACIDQVGVLDTTPYMGGLYLTPVTATTLLSTIFAAIGVPYYLDPALASVQISGWIPAGSYRSALQHIGFAIGATITCSRSGVVQIYQTVLASVQTIFADHLTAASKGQEQQLTLKTLITGVNITAHNYVSNTTVAQLFSGSLAVGTYTITFSAPAHDLSVSGASISSSGANYAILVVSSPGTVTLSGQGYTDTTQIFSANLSGLDPSIQPNIITIQDATLVNSSNGAAVLALVFNYYQQRYKQEVKLYSPGISAGSAVQVDTMYERIVNAVVEKVTYDLSGGFTAQVEATGILQ